MKYNVEFESGYVKSFVKDENGAFEFDANKLKLEYLNCYKASGTTLILDEEKYNTLVDTKTKENEIARLKAELTKYDYIGTKIAMGVATKEDYADKIAHTEEIRKQIRILEGEVR